MSWRGCSGGGDAVVEAAVIKADVDEEELRLERKLTVIYDFAVDLCNCPCFLFSLEFLLRGLITTMKNY